MEDKLNAEKWRVNASKVDLAKEVFDNNEVFSRSTSFTLSLREQRKQGIAAEDRIYSWKCCLYNFAHNIIHGGMSAPADVYQEGFVAHFKKYYEHGVSEGIAVAAANVKIVKIAYEKYFCTQGATSFDQLFVAIKQLDQFYDDYTQCENPEKNFRLITEGNILATGMSVFLPAEIKDRLKIY